MTPPRAVAVAVSTGRAGVWLRSVSRLGLVSRGAVYLLVGYLALRLVLAGSGRRDSPASSAGAVQQLAVQPWGRAALVVLSVGLAAYALTQLVEALFRPAHADGRLRGWQQRGISAWGCLLYAAFSVTTIRQVVAPSPQVTTAQSEQRQRMDLTAALLQTTPGRLLVVAVGLAVVVGGVELGRRSLQLNFRERFLDRHLNRRLALVAKTLGMSGCIARGVVFVLVGAFLVAAGVQSDSELTKGLDAVFRFVADTRSGAYLAGALAVGLLCYGAYCLLEARYRDLTPGQ